jgi:hypothetical protein
LILYRSELEEGVPFKYSALVDVKPDTSLEADMKHL